MSTAHTLATDSPGLSPSCQPFTMPPILQNVLSAENPSFHLDASGLAGFFGGQEAVSAMNTVQLYTGRRWLGWYNSPGGYEVAKHYGQLAKSPFWRGFCPGARIDPAELFGLNAHRNPEFLGVHTGVIMKDTGHLGHLFFRNMKGMKVKVERVGDRETTPQIVTVVKLKDITLEYPKKSSTITPPDSKRSSSLSSVTAVPNEPKYKPVPFTASIRDLHVLFGSLIPILSSLVCTILCALHGDWFAFSLILLGMLANGITCCIFGSGLVKINFVSPPDKSPPGDGLMMLDGSAIIVLGAEKEIYQFTRAHISVEFPDWIKWRDYSIVGCCSVFSMLQLLAQILLIPQATLFGQILFLGTLAVSWGYNFMLSAIDKDDLLSRALEKKVWDVDEESVKRYQFPNRTVMAVASLYLLRASNTPLGSGTTNSNSGISHILKRLIPNKTPVWLKFKGAVLDVYPETSIPDGKIPIEGLETVPEDQKVIVNNMYEDWRCALQVGK